MKVFINEKSERIGVSKCKNLHDAVTKVFQWCAEKKLIISHISFDNTPYNDSQSGELKLKNVSELHVSVSEEHDFLSEVISDALDYIPRLKVGVENSFQSFQAGNIQDGLLWFNRCFDGLEWLNTVLVKLNVIYNQNNIRMKEFEILSDEFLSFSKWMTEIFKALKNQDYVSVSDILEYNISQNLDTFMNCLSDLKKNNAEKEQA